MTTPPTQSSSTKRRRAASGCRNERAVRFQVELRILSHASSSAENIDERLDEEELLNRSVGLIDSYLSRSDDPSLCKLQLDLFGQDLPQLSASLATSHHQHLDQDVDPVTTSLGEDALEHCIPPPYHSPAVSVSNGWLMGDRSGCSTDSHKPSILDQQARLRFLKPWHHFTSLCTTTDPTYDLKRLSTGLSPDSQRRGFWLIPVWKSTVTRSDYYGRFGHLISLPRWSDPTLSQSINPPSTTPELQKSQIPTPIIWNPIRLSLFWNVICIICEKRKLGNVSAMAVATSHTKDILPYTQPISGNKNPGPLEPESVVGDHLRIWSSLQASLIVRRVISDITIKSAIQAHDSNKHSSVPFLNFNSSREDLEKQAGDYEHKWLKNCAFMWLDESGTPKGYG